MLRILICLVLFVSCQQAPPREKEKKDHHTTTPQQKNGTIYQITTTRNEHGWGYQIRQNQKLLLDQPTVPGRPGIQGFQNQEDAQKVAELVVSKLKANIFPPTVSEDDLKNLNIH